MTVQFLITPGGDELAVLPRAEYEALIDRLLEMDEAEDAADVAMYDACKADPSPTLPPEISARMLRGDSLLKALRGWRGLTQVDIEAATGIGQGYLSDLESGRCKGTPETMAKLAVVRDISPAWLAR